MDGINGITACYSLVVLILLAIVNQRINFIDENLIYYSIIATLVFGFLISDNGPNVLQEMLAV